MSFRGRAFPVITGPDGPGQGPPIECAACKTTDGVRVPAVMTGGVAVALCRDASACCDRYRGGASPEEYGALLRREALAGAR